MEELRACWRVAGSLYASVESRLRCPDGASNHTHCRAIIRHMIPDKERAGSMDAMIRCYPLPQLRTFLEAPRSAKSHRRCRGGLLAFLRLLCTEPEAVRAMVAVVGGVLPFGLDVGAVAPSSPSPPCLLACRCLCSCW